MYGSSRIPRPVTSQGRSARFDTRDHEIGPLRGRKASAEVDFKDIDLNDERLARPLAERLRSHYGPMYIPIIAPHGQGLGCKQNKRFRLSSVCNTIILLYTMLPKDVDRSSSLSSSQLRLNIHKSGQASVANAWYKEDPMPIMEGRHYFVRCSKAAHDPEANLEDFVKDHKVLCDWIEDQYKKYNMSFARSDKLLPTMRAVAMVYWPGNSDFEEERVALVLTGDNSNLKGGPIDVKDLLKRRLPGYVSNDKIIYVSLKTAVKFLAALDRREQSNDFALRTRNEACAKILWLERTAEA